MLRVWFPCLNLRARQDSTKQNKALTTEVFVERDVAPWESWPGESGGSRTQTWPSCDLSSWDIFYFTCVFQLVEYERSSAVLLDHGPFCISNRKITELIYEFMTEWSGWPSLNNTSNFFRFSLAYMPSSSLGYTLSWYMSVSDLMPSHPAGIGSYMDRNNWICPTEGSIKVGEMIED